jgi:hypothetical protein
LHEGFKQAVGFQVPEVSIGLDEEKCVGSVTLRGTARKVGEVDLHLPEGFQCGNQRARFVLDAKHDEGLVVASGRIDLTAENDVAHPGGLALRISLGKNFRADREVGGGQLVERGIDESMNKNELQNEFLRVALALSKSQLCSSGGGLLQGE